MKILLINNNDKPLGGAETYFFSLRDMLSNHGHEVFVFATGDKEIDETHAKVFKNNRTSRFWKYIDLYINLQLFFYLRSWIKKINPDVIHINNTEPFTLSILWALWGLKIPIVKTVHDLSIICPSRLFTKPNGQKCDGTYGIGCVKSGCISLPVYTFVSIPRYLAIVLHKIIVNNFLYPSKAIQDRLVHNGFKKTTYLHNFIDTNKFDHIHYDPTTLNLLFVGRLAREKGISCLINAFPGVLKSNGSCILNIVGDGPEMPSVQKLVKDLGLSNQVVFKGRIQDNELKNEYCKANVVIMPSIWIENNPYVILEAMASGKPVIASKIGGIPELVIDNETGILVDPGNVTQLTDAIILILTHRSIADEMGKKARYLCKTEYSVEKYYNGILAIYKKAIFNKN